MALSGGVRTICGMLWQVLVLRKDTRRFYDAFAGQYDALVGGQPDAEGIARFVADSWPGADSEAGPLLELGCGTGLLTAHLVSAGLPVVGVDFSRGQLAVLQGKDLP
ncbi:MAG: class I SAM-dependent methyltransferase, partial [Dehalococcoidia bacterium]